MNGTAVMIHADGEVERLSEKEAVGLYIYREQKCCECGHVKGVSRKFKAHFATRSDKATEGTIVFIEVPA